MHATFINSFHSVGECLCSSIPRCLTSLYTLLYISSILLFYFDSVCDPVFYMISETVLYPRISFSRSAWKDSTEVDVSFF